MTITLAGTAPTTYLIHSARTGATVEVVARMTVGQMVLGVIGVAILAVQLWRWWSDRLADFLEGL